MLQRACLDTAFSIRREPHNWEIWVYRCTDCGSVSPAVKDISHTEDCLCQEPDDVELPISDSSARDIQQLIYNVNEEFTLHGRESVEEVKELVEDRDGVRWVAQGSSARFVASLGRTSTNGDFHLPDRRPLVLKLDPFVRFHSDITPISGNIAELLTWEVAGETGTRHLFGEILGAARDGAWLLMEQCIPVYRQHRSAMYDRDAVWDQDATQYLQPLRNKLRRHGWLRPDWKHGNFGLSDIGGPVVIDYGTGPSFDPDSVDPSNISPAVIERAGGEFPPPIPEDLEPEVGF